MTMTLTLLRVANACPPCYQLLILLGIPTGQWRQLIDQGLPLALASVLILDGCPSGNMI